MFQRFLYVNLNFYCNKQLSSFPHLFKYLFTTIWTVDIYLIPWFIIHYLYFILQIVPRFGHWQFLHVGSPFFFLKHFITFWYHMIFQTHVNFFSLVISPRSSGSFYFRLASRNQELMSNVLTAMVNKEIHTRTHKHTSVSFSIFICIYVHKYVYRLKLI